MPATASPPPRPDTRRARTALHPYCFSRAQYERMVDAGVFVPDQQVELIEGRIVPMSPQNSRHTITVERIRRALERICPEDAYVRTQYPLALGGASEPEPDVAVVPGTLEDHLDAHPSKALLVVEVADTSLAYDRDTKRRLYAAHGIPTYWIANLNASALEVYTDPDAGDYRTKHTLTLDDSVRLLQTDASLPLTDIFPT